MSCGKTEIVIFENVKRLLRHDNGATLATILQELQSAGYTTEYKVFKCSDYGLPQRRERLFIVGVHNAEAPGLLDFSAYQRDVSLTKFMSLRNQ